MGSRIPLDTGTRNAENPVSKLAAEASSSSTGAAVKDHGRGKDDGPPVSTDRRTNPRRRSGPSPAITSPVAVASRPLPSSRVPRRTSPGERLISSSEGRETRCAHERRNACWRPRRMATARCGNDRSRGGTRPREARASS